MGGWTRSTSQSESKKITLNWCEFKNIKEAIDAGFGGKKKGSGDKKKESFVYAITNSERKALYVGKASKGFQTRYHGGTHTAIDAVIEASGNRNRPKILLAQVDPEYLEGVESELIYTWRRDLKNVRGKKKDPKTGLCIQHKGKCPTN